MIIILDDDSIYVSWIRRHRVGYVLDTKRRPTRRNTTLHRASCSEIRNSKTRRTHWTTGRRMKACSEERGELTEWAREQIGSEPEFCNACDPASDLPQSITSGVSRRVDRHPTKLENDIVSAVVESAVIQLDNDLDYQVTVAEVAKYVSKTPGQILAALRRLVSEQMLEIEGAANADEPILPTLGVFPTASSLCTVPAFADLDAADLQRELARLHARVG